MNLTQQSHAAEIRYRREEGQSYRKIAGDLGVSRDALTRFVKLHMPELHSPPPAAAELPPTPDELELVKAELKALKAAGTKHRTIDVQAELLLEEVRQLSVPAPVRFEAPEQAEGDGHPHAQVLLLSDLHIGELVVPEAINGMNEYNWGVFQDRMAAVFKGLLSFQNNRPYPIDELLICLLGDNVSNSHHKELEVTNEFPITEQCHRGGVFLGQWIEALVPHYPRIRVVGVGGNHGRVDHKPSSKHVFDSFDWLGYQFAGQHLANYDTVECHFPRAGMLVCEVAGRNLLIWHGDGVRSTMPGVPWGGVMRRVNELKKQFSEQGVHIDYVALGHFHETNVIRRNLFMNGSLMGLTEYGLKNFGSGDSPAQLLLTFDRTKRRLTDCSFITP